MRVLLSIVGVVLGVSVLSAATGASTQALDGIPDSRPGGKLLLTGGASSPEVVGVEYRTKPDNPGFAAGDDGFDVYAAWALNRHLPVTAAWVDLGSIAIVVDQRGFHLSLQTGF